MNLAVQPLILDPVAAYRARGQLTIPTLQDVSSAAELMPRPDQPARLSAFGHRVTRQSPRAYEAPRWFLTVAPGVVSVARRITAPREHFGHTDGVEPEDDHPTRGRVTEWSAKSRNRMTTTLESLDYGPMFESERPAAMVTLTLPGRSWEQLVPDVPTFKNMVARFTRAYVKAWGHQLRGVWKMEFQLRGAPHLHILMVPPVGLSRGRGITANKSFSTWLGIRWAQIVGSTGREFEEHALWGCETNYKTVARYSDPRRIGSYFAKHGSFGAKEYQNEMPEHWRQAILAGESGGGNFWGYWGLDKAEATVELTTRAVAYERHRMRDAEPVMHRHEQPVQVPPEVGSPIMSVQPDGDLPPHDAVLAMRHLRKLARSRSFVRKVEVDRLSIDMQTGEIRSRRRRVNRRVSYLAGRSRGFLAVNDGPSTALDIARILHHVEGPGRDPRKARYGLIA